MLNKFDFKANNTKEAVNNYYNQQYKLSAEPFSWLNQALKLKRAADHIFNISLQGAENSQNKFLNEIKGNEFKNNPIKLLEGKELEWSLDAELNRIYYMLIGLALENLFKGILIKTTSDFLTSGKLNHNLVEYAEKCSFLLTNDLKFILEELQKDVEWRGKYPIPKNIDKLRSRFNLGGATNIRDAYFPGHDLINEMFDNLLKVVSK